MKVEAARFTLLMKKALMMRIFVLNYEYPPIGAGAGKIAAALATEWAKNGYEITFVTAGYRELNGESLENGIKVVRLPSARKHIFRSNPREMLSWIKHAKNYCLTLPPEKLPDFCFAHFSIPGGQVAYHLYKQRGIPYFVMSHWHDIPWLAKKEMLFFHLLTFCRIKKICLNAKNCFLQSKAMKKNIDRFTGKKYSTNNIVIPNGFYPDESIDAVQKLKAPNMVLFAARLVKQKNPMLFLKAAKAVLSKRPETQFVIAGNGPLFTKMQNYVKANLLEANITFCGWLPENEMKTMFRKASVFVSTSRYEGMSMTIMEALSYGAYVVATPVSNNEALLKNENLGKLSSFHDAEIIANDIMLALNSSHYQCEKSMLKSYEWPEVARQYLKYFQPK